MKMKQIFIATFLLAAFVFSGVQSAVGQTDAKLETEIGKAPKGIFDSGYPSAFMSFAPKIIEAILLTSDGLK